MAVRILGFRDSPRQPAAITPWSLVHLLFGMAMKSIGLGFWVTTVLHLCYEIKDQVAEHDRSLLNSAGDQAFAMVGPR